MPRQISVQLSSTIRLDMILRIKEPLFYEAYPGSSNDVSQLRTMLGKITGYGYKKIGFILDRDISAVEIYAI